MSQALPDWAAAGEHGMVVSDSPHASRAGLEILQAGGNAIDAATATSFALAVTRPYSAGLGGGGFLMFRAGRTGEAFILDYRETAPGGAAADMFVKARGARADGPAPSRFGGLAAGVPGHVAGHAMLLSRFGLQSFYQVLQPAHRLAKDGFTIDANYREAVEDTLGEIDKYHLQDFTTTLRSTHLFAGRIPTVGTIVYQPELAKSLETIAHGGPGAFYGGSIGKSIVDSLDKAGGIITRNDLGHYRPKWREPLRARYRTYEVLLMPPSSSGGACLAETLNILENRPLAEIHGRNPGLAAHLTVEAMKHAFADRARHMGDSDFVHVPIDKLMDKAYARELAGRIREDGVSRPEDYGRRVANDAGTTHYCIADRWGNVVAATETINTGFGSMVMAEGTGIVLNNEMDDFTAEPGKKNAFGLVQSPLNEVAPGKRPLSSMSPTIVLSEGKPVLAVGASGGPRIISATLQVVINVLDYQLPVEQAIGAPRFHHQWDPDVVYRNRFAAEDPAIEGLRQRGHVISDQRKDAVVQALQIKDGRYTGASDPRKGGQPAGY